MRKDQSKLRILHLISRWDGITGPIRTVLNASAALITNGHDVRIAYFIGDSETFVKSLTEVNITAINLGSQTCSPTRFQRLTILSNLIRLIVRCRIQVIHAHHFDADYYAALAGRLMGCRVIVTVHSLSYLQWIQHIPMRYYSIVFPLVHAFVNVSMYMQREFLGHYPFLEKKTYVVHNGVPTNYFKPKNMRAIQGIRSSYGITDMETLIGFVGNYHAVKGFDYFLNALAHINTLPFKVLILGINYDCRMDEFRRFLTSNRLENKVIFHGFCEDMKNMLDSIDIFVCSSIEESDSWAVTEAMAAGKPVVATSLEAIKEKIINGKTGILVPRGDSKCLAEKIKGLMLDHELRKLIGQQAQDFIRQNYSSENMAKGYERLYWLNEYY